MELIKTMLVSKDNNIDNVTHSRSYAIYEQFSDERIRSSIAELLKVSDVNELKVICYVKSESEMGGRWVLPEQELTGMWKFSTVSIDAPDIMSTNPVCAVPLYKHITGFIVEEDDDGTTL